ncbi:Na+/H+ antiporter NhaA [Streptomyces xanthophaeus]
MLVLFALFAAGVSISGPAPAQVSTSLEPTRRRQGLAVLAGIGSTVALLIGELAYPSQTVGEHVKAPVLIASVTAAVLAAGLLRCRKAPY